MATPTARPATLKLIEGRGNGRDSGGRTVKETPGFTRLPPEAPEVLPEDARLEWERVVPELQRLQLTKPIDAAAMTAYCLAYSRMMQAQRTINADGMYHHNSQGLSRHPAVSVLEAASRELRAWAAEFGLTPSAEQRVGQAQNGGGGDSPFGS